MPFTNFNGIVQTTANSCGAFALAAAMDNFGMPLPNQNANLLSTANLATGYSVAGPVVSSAGGASAFAESIYPVTGNLLLDLTVPDATYQYLAPVSDMNSPSTLAYVASLFGFAPVVYYDATGFATFNGVVVTNPTGQGNLFDTEVAIMATEAAITVTPSLGGYTTLPAANQVHILLVDNNHWIAINNTQLYDPATGYVGVYNVNAPLPLVTITYMHNGIVEDYDFSGIWIEL
ncbi:MAG TPA: hypothetical protein VNS58_12570 [Puia sp.]|nr:hypothetical protein [Puia sp.]